MALILTSKKNINSIGHPDANNYGQQEKKRRHRTLWHTRADRCQQ